MCAVGVQLLDSKGFFFAAISDARSEAAVIAQIPVALDTARFPASVSPEQQIFRNIGFYSSPVAPTPTNVTAPTGVHDCWL